MTTNGPILLGLTSLLFAGCLAGNAGDDASTVDPLTRNGKVCGAPNYACSRTDKAIVQLSTIPDVTAGVNTIVRDPLFHSSIVRCTGVGTETAHPNFTLSGGMGGSGDVGSLWNTNSTALHINDQGGRGFLMSFTPSKMQCGHFFTDTSGNQFNVGSGMFSKTQPTLWYAYGRNQEVTSPTQINTYAIDQTAGTVALTTAPMVANFIHAIGHDAPAWHASTTYEYGAMVTGNIPAPDWEPANATLCTVSSSTTPPAGSVSHNGSMIVPSVNNPAGHAFVCLMAGTTAASTAEPVWSHFYNGDVTDGGAKWTDLGAPPEFVYQLTGPTTGGKSAAAAPSFLPGLLYTVEDAGLTWTNIGTVQDATWVSSAGGVSVDATKFTSGFSTNTYSSTGGQNTGIFVATYDAKINVYHLLNTGTGIVTDFTCKNGTGPDCTQGTFVEKTIGNTLQTNSTNKDLSYIHNVKASEDGAFVVVASENCISASCGFVYHIWTPGTLTYEGLSPSCAGHWTRGYSHFACEGRAGLEDGTYFTLRDLADPSGTPNGVWTESTCGGAGQPPCTPAFDGHWNWAKNDGSDTTPIFGSTYNVTAFPYTSPYQNEVVGFSTVPPYVQWRFTHTFATATNDIFDAQYVVGQMAQAGDFYAWTSDWAATLGSSTGAVPTFPVKPNPANANCLGGFAWQASYSYKTGTMIHPAHGYTNYDVFQAVATTGASAASTPDWTKAPQAGNQIVDGGVTWQNLGPGNCRGDLFIVRLD